MGKHGVFLLLFLAVLASSLALGYIMGVQTTRQYFMRCLEEAFARAEDLENQKAKILYNQIKEVVKAFNQVDREHIYFASIDGDKIVVYMVTFDGIIFPVIEFTYDGEAWGASKVLEGGESLIRTLAGKEEADILADL